MDYNDKAALDEMLGGKKKKKKPEGIIEESVKVEIYKPKKKKDK